MNVAPGWDLPQSMRDRLGDSAGRQRAMIDEGHLLLILHKVPERNNAQRIGVCFWRSPAGEWKHQERGSGLVALKEHIESYHKAIEELDHAQDIAIHATQYLAVLEAAGPINRATTHLHDALQQARDAMPKAKELIPLRDRAYEVSRAADLLYNDTRNGLECAIARRGEEQAAASHSMATTAHRLNMLMAIFLPLTAVASIFGMNNIRHGFEDVAGPTFFWGIVTGCLIAGLIVALSLSNPSAPHNQDEKK